MRIDSKYSPALRPVLRLTWRSSRSSRRSLARSRISEYNPRRSFTTTQTGAPWIEPAACVREHVRDALDVRLDRSAADASRGTTELLGPAFLEPEELVRVAVLLVVIDQPGIRR